MVRRNHDIKRRVERRDVLGHIRHVEIESPFVLAD
jgi:hypothetical protein